ncbi:kinase-like domain-containing protein [Hygrophoropsis aurantiaca]|uniref:Kinase-like domain-containing protein n=1 Tax=Hygrophoropsis aurantiaca TaxID=72124 RepID=A0ACB8A8X7_9AGAM|nr:kinase-like domain-containing protein [Hygrophoropsis aurantiaca]
MGDCIPRRLGNFYLEECIGSGYSGSIFKAYNIHTHSYVALKVQHLDHECPTNKYERGFYPVLQGCEGIPMLWASGVQDKWDYLAISLLGPSLDNLIKKSGKAVMDLRTVCSAAIQIITRLQSMHGREILHRDIQLGNCVIGRGPTEQTIYMIDFGFSKRYIDPHTRRHLPESKEKRDFIGNYWFTSVNVHCRGTVPTRRDDMEAVALMLIHMLTPNGLTWTRNGVPKTDELHERIKRAKKRSSPESLCRGMPSVFEEFLRYCRKLKFAECPDYDYWKEEFRELARQQGFASGIEEFVWPPPPLPVKPAHVTPRRVVAAPTANMENILHDLAKLQLNDRPILGDQTNIPAPPKPDKPEAKKPAQLGDVIEISSDDEDTSRATQPRAAPTRTSKAIELSRLQRALLDAKNNAAIADAVAEFTTLLQSSRSRALTIDGFAFLDKLYKQLANPSTDARVQPLRTSRTRSGSSLDGGSSGQAPSSKLNIVAGLRRDVGSAQDRKVLAKMVADFGAVTDKSSGRNITKDGFAFLEGVAERLRALT